MHLDFHFFKPWLLQVFSFLIMKGELNFDGDRLITDRLVLFGKHLDKSPLLLVSISQRAGKKRIDGCDEGGK